MRDGNRLDPDGPDLDSPDPDRLDPDGPDATSPYPKGPRQGRPDWKRFVREHLPDGGIRRERKPEIEEEIAAHLEDVYQEALRAGASEEAACAAVANEIDDWGAFAERVRRTRLGAASSQIDERLEESETSLRERGRGWTALADLHQEVRFAIRRLRRAPGFAGVVLLTLGLGIGATTAIFSVVKAVLLDPLPFNEPERLVGIWNAAPGMGEDQLPQSLSLNAVYEDEASVLDAVGVWTLGRSSVMGTEGPTELLDMRVTQGVFRALQVEPVLGRSFTFEDTQPASPLTVILAHRYWEERFGSDPDVLGQTLNVGGAPREIIGVMPRGFRFMDRDPAFYQPIRYSKAALSVSNFGFRSVGRLAEGIAGEQAVLELGRLLPLVFERYPGAMTLAQLREIGGWPVINTLREDLVGNVGSVLWVVLGGVVIILLVAAANVANLLLVRIESRERLIAVQSAMGSPKTRLVGQFLTESMVLAMLGGGLGIGLAYIALELLQAMGPGNLPRLHEVGLDAGALAFTIAISLLTGAALGLFPVARFWRTDWVEALKEGGRGSSAGKSGTRTRNLLVVGQLALALVLLVGSGLMIRSFISLSRVRPGFSAPEELLTFRLFIGSADVPDQEEVAAAHERMSRRLAGIPGVTSVGLSSSVSMDGRGGFDPIYFEDFPLPEGQAPQIRRFKWVGGNYVETMGNPVVAGRSITWDDIHNRARVVMITESIAREAWGDPSRAVGRRIGTGFGPGNWREIVGVVGDVRDDGMEQGPVDIVYWPMVLEDFWDNPFFVMRGMGYAVRSSRVGTPDFLTEVRNAVWSSYPTRPLGAMVTMDELQRGSMARTSFTLVMLGLAAVVALVMGVVGIYGVISYAVGRRTREIGLRIAMGAEPKTVTGMVLKQGLLLSVVGLAVGWGGAFGTTRLMESILHGVDPVDPLTFVVVGLSLVAVALLATYLPARRAARLDPMVALRAE